MIRLLSQLHRTRKAVAALEFALLATPLLLLVLGILEFGRLMWFREALQMTANEGARCMGVVASSCASGGAYNATNTTTYIENVANNWGITLANANVALARPSTNANCVPTQITVPVTAMSEVTITYTFQTAVPQLFDMLVGKSLTSTRLLSEQFVTDPRRWLRGQQLRRARDHRQRDAAACLGKRLDAAVRTQHAIDRREMHLHRAHRQPEPPRDRLCRATFGQ